ncbi:MAG: M20/M25/M40 family metallo-hydrolase [Erysipelotrichaceae bacterium]|nr:M20/M25/M40 family metallo-hydrolase [Erysipelotrichaceae bacterium]
MINKERVTKIFLEMASLSSPSGKERKMADFLIQYLKQHNIEVYEDNAGKTIDGNSGNVIGVLKAPGKKRVLLSAHMDTVSPCTKIHPILEDGIIKTDGTSVLGGDDKSGIVAILELIHQIQEQNIDHPEIVMVFSIAEETGLFGAKAFDTNAYGPIDYAFVLDSSGNPGKVIHAAPYSASGDIIIHGKEAHAGIAPEKGVNALVVAAHAISKLKIGRIDEETTCNIGTVEGGLASNIVMPSVRMLFEARSLEKEKLLSVLQEVNTAFATACKEWGATLDNQVAVKTPGYKIALDESICQIAKSACENAGFDAQFAFSMGGSDANIYNEKGIPSLNLATGMSKVHTVEEFIKVQDMVDVSAILVDIIKEINKEGV